MEKLIWDIKELAKALGRTPSSIRADLARRNWSRTPPPIKLAGSLAWRPQDVLNWLEEAARVSGALIEPSVDAEKRMVTRRRRGRPTKAEQLRQQQRQN